MYVQNRPVASTTPRVTAQPTGGAAPQPTTVAVDNYQPSSAPTYTTASTGQVSILATLGSMVSGLFNFVKNLFGKLFHSTATPPTAGVPTTTSTGTTGTPTTGGTDDATLAAQYGLLNTPQNVAAFRQVQATEQADPTVVGPGSTNTESVTELQQLLASWGFQVPATGQFDQATANAVMQFKQANGLTESFVFANGQPGVTPYVDQRCKNAMIALLQNNQTPGSTTPTTSSTTPAPSSTTPSVTVTTPGATTPTASVPAPAPAPTPTVSVTTPAAPATPTPTVTTPPVPTTPTATVTTPAAPTTTTVTTPTPAPAPTPVTVAVTPPMTTPSATPAPTTTSTATPSALTADQSATCQQEGILATPANYQAFMNDAQAIESQNALGPGSTDTQSITELQQVLAGWGYPVTVNGQFDQATTSAVLQFKQANGLQSSYVLSDGTPAYNPFIDAACKQAMIAKLGG